MPEDPGRREAWTRAATDYVLREGLIGLSLRPLAASLGTSDRMLLYHFGTKDDLVAAILREANDRSVAYVTDLPASADLRAAVHDLWSAWGSPPLEPCTRTYIEAAALGLLGREPYATVVREANDRWTACLVTHLTRSGVDRPLAQRAVTIVDAAFLGFQLDAPLDPPALSRQAVADLADAVAALDGAARARPRR
ncbi:AcrR family transcriptional regulator [Nocardioides sp. BE266]|uniref:TetR/AcrR family transcriptional regulator n=1 Tax=Nocardioides sp. BE266 TaxID=2817725 RepID=UPI002865A1D1|nr:TetR/AcrR family transcriptional regulator [Nocardioides sp. BE266]MDR7251495.1 AcrR family transcriptional regulator [Nocardioides sp. BE266]